MGNCTEKLYGDIIKIEAIPHASATFTKPLMVTSSRIKNTEITVTEDDVRKVLLQAGSAEAKETISDDTNGRTTEVSVTYTQEEHTREALEQMEYLEHHACHLRLTSVNGTSIVRASVDGYAYQKELQSDGTYSCQFTLHGLNGVQDLYEE